MKIFLENTEDQKLKEKYAVTRLTTVKFFCHNLGVRLETVPFKVLQKYDYKTVSFIICFFLCELWSVYIIKYSFKLFYIIS